MLFMKQSIPLHTLQAGEQGIITKLDTNGTIRRRLQDMGMIEGTQITCMQKSLWGDPAAYGIRGSVIALRAQDAAQILVTPGTV